jgi:hypothetical protein
MNRSNLGQPKIEYVGEELMVMSVYDVTRWASQSKLWGYSMLSEPKDELNKFLSWQKKKWKDRVGEIMVEKLSEL